MLPSQAFDYKIIFHTDGMNDDIWDCVAVSAADLDQKNGFEQQIQLKLENGEIPKSVSYVVIADPAPSLGSGGASFHGALLAYFW